MTDSDETAALRVGTIIETPSHRYRLIRKIKQGGFGVTYEVENLERFVVPGTSKYVMPGARLAIKECFSKSCMVRLPDGMVRLKDGSEKHGAELRHAFFSEAKAMVALQKYLPYQLQGDVHRAGLVPVFHAGIYCGDHPLPAEDEQYEADCVFFYVMPYIEGSTMERYVGRMAPSWVVWTLYRLLKALERMHTYKDSRGVIRARLNQDGELLLHRDLKPGNIMLADGSESAKYPVLIDYGGAVLINVRTERYASPEQAKGFKPSSLTAETDLYSLGVTMYELITGRPPVRADERVAALAKTGKDLYEKEQLCENAELVRVYEEYGISEGYEPGWGRSFLLGIDIALKFDIKERWSSAREWRKSSIFQKQRPRLPWVVGDREPDSSSGGAYEPMGDPAGRGTVVHTAGAPGGRQGSHPVVTSGFTATFTSVNQGGRSVESYTNTALRGPHSGTSVVDDDDEMKVSVLPLILGLIVAGIIGIILILVGNYNGWFE